MTVFSLGQDSDDQYTDYYVVHIKVNEPNLASENISLQTSPETIHGIKNTYCDKKFSTNEKCHMVSWINFLIE